MGHSVTMVKEALRPHADYLVRAGFVVLALDYRTIGSSAGEPRGQWFPEQQVQDMRAGVSYLQEAPRGRPGTDRALGPQHRRPASPSSPAPSIGGSRAWSARTRACSTVGRRFTTSLGRAKLRGIRALLERDFELRYETGAGTSIPAIATDDPKLAGYVAQAERLFPGFTNRMTVESLEHVLLWAPVHFLARLAPTPLLLVTGVDDEVHAIDEVLDAYERALQPKRLELLPVDEFGLSIEPGLGQAMNLAADFFDQQLRRAPRIVPSPTPAEALARGLRPEYRGVRQPGQPVRPPEDIMNVLLAGASGALGIPLTRQLLVHDHQVMGLTRGPCERRPARPRSARDRSWPTRWTATPCCARSDGLAADAVIHQLTALKQPPLAAPRHGADRPAAHRGHDQPA